MAALGAALLAGGLRGALVHVGLAIAGGGLLVAAVVAGLGEFVAAHAAHAANLDEDAERDAIRAVWSALFGDLRSAALIAALGGALLAAIASVALPAVDPGAGWRWVRGAALSPSRTARTLRAAVLIAAGAAIVFEPALLGRIAVAAGGVLVVILGLAQLSGTPEPREEAVASVAGGARPRPRPWAPAAAVVLVVVATGLAMAIVLPGPRIAPVAVVGRAGRLQRSARDVRPPPGPGRDGRRPTTPTRRPTSRAGCSPTSASGSRGSCATGSARCSSTSTSARRTRGAGASGPTWRPRDRTATRSRASSAPPRCAPPTASSAARASAGRSGGAGRISATRCASSGPSRSTSS